MRLRSHLATVSLLALALVMLAGVAFAAGTIYPVMTIKKDVVVKDAVSIMVKAATTSTETPQASFEGTVTLWASTESSVAGFAAYKSLYTTGAAAPFVAKPIQNTWFKASYGETATAPQMVGVAAKLWKPAYSWKKSPVKVTGTLECSPTPTADVVLKLQKWSVIVSASNGHPVKPKYGWADVSTVNAPLTAKGSRFTYKADVPVTAKGTYQIVASYEDAKHVKATATGKKFVKK